jgi:hypothetical protein
MSSRSTSHVLVLVVAMGAAGCATLQQMTALRSVDFALDRVADIRLAGIEMARVESYTDLSFGDGARLVAAVANGQLPLAFDLHVTAHNQDANAVTARLVRMQWIAFLEGRETVSGTVDREYLLPPGEPQDIPIRIELDVLEFFEGNAQDLFELVQNLTGTGGEPKEVALRAVPTIETSIGPISYPQPITIVAGEIGR